MEEMDRQGTLLELQRSTETEEALRRDIVIRKAASDEGGWDGSGKRAGFGFES
jgi:hypothetical protein